jgi:flagellar biosynthesis protein FlhF
MDIILVDYPGMSLKEMDEVEKLRQLLPPETNLSEKHLVLSAGLQDKDALDMVERYRVANPTDIIFTKLDEAITHGLIYNFQRKYDLPLFSFGVGPKLPEDFEFSTQERVVDLIFKITKFARKDAADVSKI